MVNWASDDVAMPVRAASETPNSPSALANASSSEISKRNKPLAAHLWSLENFSGQK